MNSDFQRLDMGQHLRGEGFVDFPELNVGIGQRMTRQKTRNRVGQRHQQAFGAKIHRRNFPVDQFHTRRVAAAFQSLLRGDPDARCTIGQRREFLAVSVPLPLLRSNDGDSRASFSSDVSLRGMVSRRSPRTE
jgi:hypothetical protein